MTYEINQTCPHCGHRFDSLTMAIGPCEKPPSDGDFTICIRCGNFAMFRLDAISGNLFLDLPDPERVKQLHPVQLKVMESAKEQIRSPLN